MPLTRVNFAPGIDKQNTTVGAEGRWVDCNNVRFRYQLPEKVGGWSSLITDTKLELIATGEKAGLWGTITNTNLQILEQSATGYLNQSMASGDVTLTLTNGATSDGKNAFYELTGTLTDNRTLLIWHQVFLQIQN